VWILLCLLELCVFNYGSYFRLVNFIMVVGIMCVWLCILFWTCEFYYGYWNCVFDYDSYWYMVHWCCLWDVCIRELAWLMRKALMLLAICNNCMFHFITKQKKKPERLCFILTNFTKYKIERFHSQIYKHNRSIP
jgi:hypothetical protein